MITGGLRQVWQDKLPEAHAELEAHFIEKHGFDEEGIWRKMGGKIRVATGYLKDLPENQLPTPTTKGEQND